REVAERLVDGGLVWPVVDLEEELARLHIRAILVVLLEQVPLHAGHDLRVHEPDGRPHPLGVDRDILLDDLGHEDLWRRRRWRVGSVAGGAEGDRERGEHHGTGKPSFQAQYGGFRGAKAARRRQRHFCWGRIISAPKWLTGVDPQLSVSAIRQRRGSKKPV